MLPKFVSYHLRSLLVAMLISFSAFSLKGQPFVHPGLLQGKDDFERMKRGIADKSEPIYSGFIAFRDHPQSQYTYKMQGPFAVVGRNPTFGQTAYDADANAAFQNAVMWVLTGNRKFAEKAIEIEDGWASTLKRISGKDAVLMAGLGPFKMINAAEILRYSGSGWAGSAIKRAEEHFQSVIYPVLKDYAPFANGNWDSAALKTVLSIAVFTNNRQMFDNALCYYENGGGDGRLTNYIINETGQCQESGRDQAHAQLGIAHLADCAEIAWHQGLDLYGLSDDRLLKGFEYTAKFNLGMDVPYLPAMDRTGKYWHSKISEDGRNKLRAIYEEVYNHYVNRMGKTAPFTQKAAESVRPELQALPGADHIGFGTLLYSRVKADAANEKSVTTQPGGLFATFSDSRVKLSWVPVIGARGYVIKRSENNSGYFKVITTGLAQATYEDKNIISGRNYYYRVCAINGQGQAGGYAVAAITAGLPGGWQFSAVGHEPKDIAYGIGECLTIDAKGARSEKGEEPLLVRSVNPEKNVFTFRYVPQLTSQFTSFGMSFGKSPKVSPDIVLLVLPSKSGQIEAPEWGIQLRVKGATNDSLKTVYRSSPLSEPIVTFNRMTGYCWLKLECTNETCAAFFSADGKNWQPAGVSKLDTNVLSTAGIIVNSNLKDTTTTVQLDNVLISK